MNARRGVIVIAVLGALGLVGAACSSPDSSQQTNVVGPSFALYPDVDNFIAKRCGTLDCHGQVGRPLRLYGQTGLRLTSDDSGAVTGFSASIDGGQVLQTTPDELRANYEAIVALQPEVMNSVVQDHGSDPMRLLFLAKPRLKVPHQGGLQMTSDSDPGYVCVTSWLATDPNETDAAVSTFDPGACQAAAAVP